VRPIVTGWKGFIGKALFDSLVNYDPTGLENIQQTDDNWFEGRDIVYHLAAHNPTVFDLQEKPLESANDYVNTLILLDKMRRNDVRKIVFTSSSTVYGRAFGPAHESSPLNPISIYGTMKAAIEQLIMGFCKSYGMHYIILRLANIVGPGAKRGIIPDLITRLLGRSDRLAIIGDGTQTKSYVYIDDCVEMIKEAATDPLGNTIYNIGNIDDISVNEIVNIVCKVMDVNPTRIHKKNWKGDVEHIYMDIKKLGHTPKYDSAQAVERTVCGILEKNEKMPA